jgi:putative SOS response-associated peptidase YedK
MCGRFALTIQDIALAERFQIPLGSWDWKPRYNVAPTQLCPTIIQEGDHRLLKLMLWGLIPHWSKEKKSGYTMINAKIETLKSKRAFKTLLHTHRCLVPASGFFDWKQTPEGKIPFYARTKDNHPFAFAALWDSWTHENGEPLNSFTILTTQANGLIATLHDRMPVILKEEQETMWLNPNVSEDEVLKPLLEPFPADQMVLYPVSQIVNSWKNDIPECVEPLKNFKVKIV